MIKLMEIKNVELITSIKKARISSGIYIEYTSKENVVKDSNIELEFEGVKHYFKVTDITINGEYLDIKAKEVGYWSSKFDNKPDFDLRNIIGLTVSKVEDPIIISKIYEMSCWC